MKSVRVLIAIMLTGAAAHAGNQVGGNYARIDDKLFMGGSVRTPPPGTEAVLNVGEVEGAYKLKIHVWKPIRDSSKAPSIAWLREQVEFVEAQQTAGRVTYVHCYMGISRSALVVVAYQMQKNNWSRDQALAYVRSKRPQARPNPAFMELLTQWERERKKAK